MSTSQLVSFFIIFIIVNLPYYCSSCYTKSNYNENGRRILLGVTKSFSVVNYGAKGDGISDDTRAFEKAWKQVCSSTGSASLLVPSNQNYLLKPLTFSGPCKANVTLKISGNILASNDRSDYEKDSGKWLVFQGIDNLVVQGAGGSIDGNGKIWWQNSCKINKKLPCKKAPTALTFYKCNHLMVKDLKIQNAQQMHVSFQKCIHVMASGLTISAPGNSPNTDGIHITNTQNILVTSAVIGTGDDCISIVNGSRKVRGMNIRCGPGHGISIGSLGDANSEAHVTDVEIKGATLSGTTNGLRIKTWQGGSGVASNIRFENVEMSNVNNPIIIDQNYCDQAEPCKQQASAVQVRDVVYRNIRGTTSSNPALIFNCSQTYPCRGIVLQDVIIHNTQTTTTPQASCDNVQLSDLGTVSPQCPSL
ncbi:polygalacturonase-like [Silene latifolia]|uniref:polygalacturonase-like n=1 Tax=Silene latifolia TaxID=37657 RepID=UPI003D76B48F